MEEERGMLAVPNGSLLQTSGDKDRQDGGTQNDSSEEEPQSPSYRWTQPCQQRGISCVCLSSDLKNDQLIEMETAKETESRRVKQLESQLYSSQEASMGVAKLEGTLIEQNTRLDECYTQIQELNNTITTLKSELARLASMEVELKRAHEEQNQLKLEIEGCNSTRCEILLKDLVLRSSEMEEAQKQMQKMKEERDGVQTRLNFAEMALQMMEKKEKESLRQVQHLNEEINQWRQKYEQLTIEMETAKETESRRVNQLDSQLYSSQQQKNNAISSSVQDLEVKLKRANEEKNQSKVVIEEYKNKPKGFEDQHESDSAPRTDQVKEAQRPAEVTTPAMEKAKSMCKVSLNEERDKEAKASGSIQRLRSGSLPSSSSNRFRRCESARLPAPSL